MNLLTLAQQPLVYRSLAIYPHRPVCGEQLQPDPFRSAAQQYFFVHHQIKVGTEIIIRSTYELWPP
jgi:hypothetical protein